MTEDRHICFQTVWNAILRWALALAVAPSLSSFAEIDFNRDIRPILSENCFQCHGPDESERKGGRRASGGLRLDTEDGATMDLDGYAALVPGDPEASELFFLATSDDEDERMPPAEHGEALDERDISLLRQWIEEGGKYDRHWSYKTVARPPVPAVEATGFVMRNPIDRFAARKLVSEGIRQSPEADRYALARRAALDLTGLPPQSDEVAAFVADSRPDAFERYVDRLLEKPSYGEHWARMWLDLARYADSAGYADDPLREIWGYRDYVIRSFDGNKPFDQFTIEQIAGDLLQNASVEQRVATAFHRNTPTNSEGGTDDEEFRNEAVVDRVNTTMSVWMGTTMACAQCHTHKYDPITQKEYFEMFAVLNSTADEDRKDEAPVIPIYTDDQQRSRIQAEKKVEDLRSSLEMQLAARPHRKRRLEWEKRLQSGEGWKPLIPIEESVAVASKAEVAVDPDGVIEIGENVAPTDNYTVTTDALAEKRLLTGIKLQVFPDDSRGLAWVLNEFEVRTVSPSVEDKEKESKPLPLVNASASYEEEGYRLIGAHDGVRGDRFSGWAADGNIESMNTAVFEFAQPLELEAGAKLKIRLSHVFPNRKIKRFRILLSEEAKPMPALPRSLSGALAKRRGARSKAEETMALAFFARFDPESGEAQAAIAEAEAALAAIKPLTTVPVMKEVPENRMRETHVQLRGSFLDKGERVSPSLLSIFEKADGKENPNRLDLAHWLVDRDNPLTARVVANRYWEALFGIGIVATSEEFGSQGEQPSHPELLDWLAAELMESGWNVQHLLKLIVTSATYRQSSVVTERQYEKDPDNRLLARGPRFRISAEMIRDQALAVSGLLSEKRFGPSVNPPQPNFGLKAAFGSETDWETSEGEDRYRRGIYTSWRRSNPYPSMATFDAPNREVCTVRRERTNTPLQALVTLNDPVYIEAAQALGRHMASFQGSIAEKAAYGFQRCLTRPPSVQEKETLVGLYENLRLRYANDIQAATDIASDPIGPIPEGGDTVDFAAWTVVANALLNLDEMFLKR